MQNFTQRQTLTLALAVGVGVGASVGLAQGLISFSMVLVTLCVVELGMYVLTKPTVRPVTDAPVTTAPNSTPAYSSVFGKEVMIPMWEITVPPEMPHVIPEDELFPADISSRKRSLRKKYIRDHSPGRYGEMHFEDPQDEQRTIIQWVFEDQAFALGLKMGAWPEEIK